MLILPYNITCGYCDSSEFGNSPTSPKHTITKFEIEFFTQNGLTTFADDKKYNIKKWHIQIAKPGQTRYSYLPFYTMFLKFNVDGELNERLMNAPEYFQSSHPARIEQELAEIIKLNEKGESNLKLNGKLLELLDLILFDSNIPKIYSGINYTVIAQSKRFIESHYNQQISLAQIAAAVNLSPSYFHNVFSTVCSCSPHNYLISCRITESKKLLWHSNISLESIAEKCGFGCQQYFNKIFKKETGISPGKYRKEFQQKYIF